jgi:hypothetical protein
VPTYYRSHEVLITSEAYVWRTDPIRVYHIRDLRNVGVVRGEQTAPGLDPAHAAAISIGAVAVVSWPVIESPVALAAGLVLALALGIVAVTSGRDRRRTYELHATYGDARVVLFASTDGQVFRQVTRGLMRAIEADPPSSWYELAGG